MNSKPLFVFPRWSNQVVFGILLFLAIFPAYAFALVGYALNPATIRVGFQPTQPVPFSHALHAGKLGMDCRYCHNTVEKAAFAAIPPTETCMNCHTSVWTNSPKIAPIIQSYNTGKPIPWVKIHQVADFVYFNHSAHVNVGVSCVECHGNINHMEVVALDQPLNMAWCLRCHRDPSGAIRPRDKVTQLDWTPPNGRTQAEYAAENNLINKYHVNPNTDCITCHR